MCELLVTVTNTVNLTSGHQRGDVIIIEDDRHAWGSGERNADVFKIIKMAGVDKETLAYLVMPNTVPIKHSAMQKIPAIARHVNKQLRNLKTRKRFHINIDTNEITDKER